MGHGAPDVTSVLISAAVGGGLGVLTRLSRLDRLATAERREKAS
jgi:hypothetical protein